MKKPSSANQDHYKVGGKSPQPNQHELEQQKHAMHPGREGHGRMATPAIAPKSAEPGKKDKSEHRP